MTSSRLLVGVASVFAGTTVLFVVFGLVYNPVILLAALPFAAATYLLWSHGTGRLEAQMRRRTVFLDDDAVAGPRSRVAGGPGRDGRRTTGAWQGGPGAADGAAGARRAHRRRRDGRDGRDAAGRTRSARAAAARVLDVAPDADDATVRRAFCEKARDLHPDAPDGDEAAFKRVRTAYETLRNEP